jgi:hypothetical protein
MFHEKKPLQFSLSLGRAYPEPNTRSNYFRSLLLLWTTALDAQTQTGVCFPLLLYHNITDTCQGLAIL